ncbi:MAG: DNA-directed RNA polymerase subunit alpha C-terminal domain-containing protein [Planctomycetota bacterium]
MEVARVRFETIPGVYEDVTDIILNIKGCWCARRRRARHLRIDVKRKARSLPGMQCPANAEVINPDHVIATLTDNIEFKVEMEARKGRGYDKRPRNGEGGEGDRCDPGRLQLLAGEARALQGGGHSVGKLTNYDKLILELDRPDGVTGDGAGRGIEDLSQALNCSVNYIDLGADMPVDEEKIAAQANQSSEKARLRDILLSPIEELDLSVRAKNCLDAENIATVRDLVTRTEADLLRMRNFGKTSLKEIKKKLQDLDLSLGMDLSSILSEN